MVIEIQIWNEQSELPVKSHNFHIQTIRIIRSVYYSNYLNTKSDVRFSSNGRIHVEMIFLRK